MYLVHFVVLIGIILGAQAQTCTLINVSWYDNMCNKFCFGDSSYGGSGGLYNDLYTSNAANLAPLERQALNMWWVGLSALPPTTCLPYAWRYICQRLWNDCSGSNSLTPSLSNWSTVMNQCSGVADAFDLKFFLGPKPTGDTGNVFNVYRTVTVSAADPYWSTCPRPTPDQVSTLAGPPLGKYIGTDSAQKKVQIQVTTATKGSFKGTVSYNTGNSVIVGYMTTASTWTANIFDRAAADPGVPVATLSGTWKPLSGNFSVDSVSNPTSSSLFPTTAFTTLQDRTIGPAAIGTKEPVFADYYLSWVYIIGSIYIVLFILIVFVSVFAMKTCGKDTDWMDLDIRTGLFFKIRIGTIIGVVLVCAACAAVMGDRLTCKSFSILEAPSLVFKECAANECSTVSACSGCGTCCVTYDTVSLNIFAFCKESLYIWFVMFIPIGLCAVAITLVFITTRKSQFM